MNKIDSFDIKGGLDEETPALKRGAGSLDSVFNFRMSINGGIERIGGYERFDGRPSPSDYDGYGIQFTGGINEPGIGEIVVGGTSGATGTVTSITITSGSWVGSDAAGYIYVTDLTGTFVPGEDIQSDAPNPGFSSGFDSGFV